MTNAIKLLTTFMAIIFLSSFTVKNSNEFFGTFGVSGSDPSQIKLTINSDHTFYYQDFSVSDQKIVVNGHWIIKGKKVLLRSKDSKIRFHNAWSFTENGQVAKSRKGLSFYRLCRIDGK